MNADPRTGPPDRRQLPTGAAMKIPLDGSYCSDELTVRFYACPDCGFDHVPYGASAWTSEPKLEDRMPEHDAKYCPGCAAPIEWTAR